MHDSDFLVEDLNNSNNEPQWFQELTNNYKLIYLKKFLHLLPSDDSNNQLVVNEAPQQESTIPQVQTENLNLNITTKNEPKSAVPSPVPQTNRVPLSMNQYQPMQPVVQNSTIDNRTIESDLNFEMNNLDLNTNNQINIRHSSWDHFFGESILKSPITNKLFVEEFLMASSC